MKLWTPGDELAPDDGFIACPNGLVLPAELVGERYRPKTRHTAVDLFCGCGGFSLGMIEAGFEIVAAVEWEAAPAVTYMLNLCRWGEFGLHFVERADRERLEKYLKKQFGKSWGDGKIERALLTDASVAGTGWIAQEPRATVGCRNFIFGDITKLTGSRLLKMIGMKRGEISCVVGSPPCQGFSVAGHMDPKDPRNNLVFEWVRLVNELSPLTCVMENVPNILNMTTADGLPIMEVIARGLEDGSFTTVNMLRKAVALQTGNVGLLNRQKERDRRRKSKRSKQKRPKQKVVTRRAA
jgi:DNA (cytosine-5)-methyltransferase 1